ncbi:unnamed protein product [Dracunculus medinensis]|uniref:JmjC domain-containing protein n=1 Tax=Dracunculus medinensis TaxID=318479 RepID=A0A0N4UGH8_DRAME|nr:unnamed protein product [Dracunculus medinensis]
MDYVKKNGLEIPLCFNDPPVQLGMTMPNASNFSVLNVKDLVGGDRWIEVVEVKTQGSRQMALSDFIDYYTKEEEREELLNVLSLEFSLTPLQDVVKSPEIAKKLDWIELYWPKELRQASNPLMYPKVQHIIINQEKNYILVALRISILISVIFWMIEPTEQNLIMYEEWILKGDQNETFFGDIVEKCCRIELNEGQTFIIPSGWIHSVYTPEDSLVFGGNFLHSFSIPMQLRVLRSEDKIKKYRYPFYNEMLWFVIVGVVEKTTGRCHLKNRSAIVTSQLSSVNSFSFLYIYISLYIYTSVYIYLYSIFILYVICRIMMYKLERSKRRTWNSKRATLILTPNI